MDTSNGGERVDLHLKEKKFVVGGGFGVIGAAICQRLFDEGAQALPLDISLHDNLGDAESVKSIFSDRLRVINPGGIHGYVSSVYDRPVGKSPIDVTPDDMACAHREAFLSALYPIQQAVRWMMETGGGTIVVITNINPTLGLGAMGYRATGAAAENIAPLFARAYGHKNIRAITLCPSTVASSPVWKEHKEKLRRAEYHIPDGRSTTPTEIAAAVAFLLSPYGRIFNGNTLTADCGWGVPTIP